MLVTAAWKQVINKPLVLQAALTLWTQNKCDKRKKLEATQLKKCHKEQSLLSHLGAPPCPRKEVIFPQVDVLWGLSVKCFLEIRMYAYLMQVIGNALQSKQERILHI